MPRFISIIALGAAALLAIGCATSGPPADPGAPSAPQPVIGDVTLIYPPDTRTPVAQIPWCDDEHGHSPVYPCKWDTRERPAPSWDKDAGVVALFVTRAQGCEIVVGKVRISEAGNVSYGCYYAPGS